MTEHPYVRCRNAFVHTLYVGILKPLFFRHDPERVHDMMVGTGALLGSNVFTRTITRVLFGLTDSRLEQTVLGIHFPNPIGLAGGFDKNAVLTDILPMVGFGFMEVGSITAQAYIGNPGPHLWRLPASKGLVVNYGLKNIGADLISKKLQHKRWEIPLGTNIAMTNSVENTDTVHAIMDYKKSVELFSDIGDYFTINISCPNTSGGQPFLDPEKLDQLLAEIDTVLTSKPVFIKLSPDVGFERVDLIVDTAKKHRVHGIICTNLTKKRDNPHMSRDFVPPVGGISGKPVQDLSDALLAHIYRREKEKFVLVGLGGVFSAEDAYKKIRLGATLVQMITGMVFEGPQVISEINRGLCELLTRDGFKNIREAIGTDTVSFIDS